MFAVWKQCIVWRFTYLYSYNKLSRRLPSLFAGIGVELTWKILFTENIVIIRAVTGIRYRIFGVESINIMELIHEGDETVHIWTVLVHINNRYILIRHTDLDIIRREQLVISHIVLFDSHESSGMISLGIAIASISTDLDLFYIFIQLWQIFLKFFIMALLDGLSMSFTSDKRCFIQLPDFYVFRCGFL